MNETSSGVNETPLTNAENQEAVPGTVEALWSAEETDHSTPAEEQSGNEERHTDGTRPVQSSPPDVPKAGANFPPAPRMRNDAGQRVSDPRLAEAEARRAMAEREIQARAQARQRDMNQFLQLYPDVKATSVPKEVWDRVHDGDSLVNAFTMFQNQQLRAQLAAQEQSRRNADRAPGSLRSQGDQGRKSIAQLWDEAGG